MTNLVTTTPTRFSVIRPDLLPPMAVLQAIDSEKIIADRMQQLVMFWAAHDPPNAAQYDVGMLEFDPIRINQELNAYFELLVRDRVNQAARAVTLAFAAGSDLDAIASRYPYGLPRIANETDDAYRLRVWLSPSILSLNGPGQGTFESYVFWALSAPMPLGELPLKHASALTSPGTGYVYIPIMANAPISNAWAVAPGGNSWTLVCGADPTPTPLQISAVYEYITEANTARKGLTDVINVKRPKVSNTTINVDLWLFPGVDKMALMKQIADSVTSLIIALRWLGADLTLLALDGALVYSGVYNRKINAPLADVIVGTDGCVNVTSVQLTYKGTGE